ncbi:MAG TPA: hypothetical protein VHS06_10805 [Chloroflexota bacterium]|nr:hypothetical protein [Chloroflexota bacterium]
MGGFSRGWVFGAVTGIAAVSAYRMAIRPWHLRWGATETEASWQLPGDELVPEPKINATHAVTIDAPPEAVWPWIAQLGQGRGGFYSYDWLENLMGLDIHSADSVIPEYQQIKEGDGIPLAPGGFDFPVVKVEPQRMLLLHGDTRDGSSPVPVKPGEYLNASWLFLLDAAGRGGTRLVERFRADYDPGQVKGLVYGAFVEPGAFLMERKMLLGIKERAERLA